MADHLPSVVDQFYWFQVRQHGVADANRPGRCPIEPAENIQQGRFSTPAWANNRNHPTGFDLDAEASQCLDLNASELVRLDQRVDDDRDCCQANLTVRLILERSFLAEVIAGRKTPANSSPTVPRIVSVAQRGKTTLL